MRTLRDTLRDADPLRHEPDQREGERDRLRRVIVATAADARALSSTRFRTPTRIWLAVFFIAVVFAALTSQTWSHVGATLQAAVRFEARLAEDQPDAGLDPARVAGSDRVVYLHPEVIVTNDDIADTEVVEGDSPSQFGVRVEFNAAGTQKMEQATAGHIGRPVAILLDGDVVLAATLRSPISTTALISGDYTRAEADRLAEGIGIH